ncbi:hypothetical protein GY03_19230 [Proteus vulgaris]|uniref:hypothetical protein n=1 Tax=Proteus vulgaris TaxID=585 RepID=UPI0021B1144B|nr:hypothetical protein [Proteus vulgaris]MCT6519407.1 hypothetical protein [Proteus vulgaris]
MYETIEGLASLATNLLETYQVIKAVIQSDNVFDTLTQAVKQSYIDRIEKLEAEYQKAGVSGSFNAGIESGKLIFDLVGLFAGGAGVAKGSSQLIAKTSAKIARQNKFSIKNLLDSANKPINSQGLSEAARAWEKHAGRKGGSFEPLKGNIENKNALASIFIEKLLKNPSTIKTELSRGGIEYRLPNGQGVRYNADGSFSGFLDPKRGNN